MINIMFLVNASFILGASCYTAYAYFWQRRCKAGFSWLNLVSLLVSLAIDVAASPLLNVPGAVPLALFGLGSGYIVLNCFAFGVMVNFFVAKPLAYFNGKSSFNAGRGRTTGFWGRRASDLTSLKQPVTRKFSRLWLVLFALLIIVPAGYTFASLQFQATISTHGNIKAVGVAFYTDSTGVCATSQIDWGTLEPGQTANVTLYMESQSNVAVSVSMAVGNFNPANGASYLACTWNYGGGTLSPGQLVAVTFTLTVASTITGITSFSFDIGVVGVAG
jgi:hypothetical protein